MLEAQPFTYIKQGDKKVYQIYLCWQPDMPEAGPLPTPDIDSSPIKKKLNIKKEKAVKTEIDTPENQKIKRRRSSGSDAAVSTPKRVVGVMTRSQRQLSVVEERTGHNQQQQEQQQDGVGGVESGDDLPEYHEVLQGGR
jgi:hypothetical protein